MSEVSSFCWLRVLEVTESTTAVRSKRTVPGDNDHGGRPPHVRSATEAGGSVIWSADIEFAGKALGAVVIDYGPAFGTREAAIHWICSDEGTDWIRPSLDYQLMGAESRSPQPPALATTPSQPARGSFPLEDWLPSFYYYDTYKPELKLVDVDTLALDPPDDSETSLNAEFQQLLALKPQRAEYMSKLVRQAQSERHAVQPVFDQVQIDLDALPVSAAAHRAWRIVQDEVWRATFHFKTLFNRARPWNHPDKDLLQPLFLRPDRLYPGHPSYPAGHAVMAYMWADLLAQEFPDRKVDLERAAEEVAWLREVAGIHYHSDTLAGRALGRQLAAALWQVRGDLQANGWSELITGRKSAT